MPAQNGAALVLGYGTQQAQQGGAAVVLEYAPATAGTRRISAGAIASWSGSAIVRKTRTAPHPKTTSITKPKTVPWAHGRALHAVERAPWVISGRKDRNSAAPWGMYQGRAQEPHRAAWGIAARTDHDAGAPWGRYETQLQPLQRSAWAVALPIDDRAGAPWAGPMQVANLAQLVRFDPSQGADRRQALPWTRYSRELAPGWGIVIPVHNPEDGEEALVVVPVRKVYMQVNTAQLRRVLGNVALPASNFSLSVDRGSWVWGFEATLPAAALPNVEPVDGAPVELEATVNGTAFRLMVDRISRDRTFGKAAIKISGRGKAALLDAPYSPILSLANAEARTAQQLMADALGATEFGADWSIDWQAVDWTVAAGAWSHTGSQIAAINAIAAAAGSYIQPHPSDLSLSVLPEYPSLPWEWDLVAPDFELPADLMSREGIEWAERARYNRVFVSGVASGVLGQVTRAGTAGDLVAPMVTDPLMSTAAAARQRAIPVLANTGRIADVSLRLPVLSETGIILPGKFVRYLDDGTTRMGLVRSTQVDVAMPTVWQTIGVETHVN